jgi:thiol-disulfide isomerase/thioredoxin
MSRLTRTLLLLILLFVLVGGGSILYNQLSARGSVGAGGGSKTAAPDFTVLDALGNEVSLSSLKGKPVVLNFWATWCGYCVDEMPEFESAFREYGNEAAFMMVNLTEGSRETLESASGYISANGYTFPVYYDTKGSAAYAYGIRSIPLTYFIDSEGTIVSGGPGAISEKALREGIESLLP